MIFAEIVLENVLYALGALAFFWVSIGLLNYMYHDPDKSKKRYPILKGLSILVALIWVLWIGWAICSGKSNSHSYDEEQNFDPRG